ncbi:MAG: IS66 family transposase [Granulosicoccus sp.]
MLFNTLLMIVNMLVAIFMERSTKKTSKNSSIPPSQTTEDQSAKTPGSNKKGPAQNDESFDNSRTVETETVAKVNRCSTCGENLSQVSITDYERRTRIDIVFEKRVEHVDAEIKHCPCCHHVTKGQFPSDLAGPVQYGLGIKAYILNLLITQMVSLSRVQKLLKTLIGRSISEAVMLKYILQLHVALDAWEQDAIRQLLASPVMHVDETSMRLDKKNHWVHVCSAGDITLKRLHAKRGSVAMDEINIIPRYGGIIIHDCWASYFSYHQSEDGLCGSHLLRELEFIIDSNGYAWAKNMKRLLKETCAKVSARKRKKLTEKEYANLQKRYRNILTRGISELPARPERPSGKRGRLAQSDAQNLWDRLYEHEYAVLLFAYHAEVPFTNNRAERDLRMGKVKQKVCGCFRQEQYAAAYCRISSYLQTMACRGYNPLVAIQLALTGKLTTAEV